MTRAVGQTNYSICCVHARGEQKLDGDNFLYLWNKDEYENHCCHCEDPSHSYPRADVDVSSQSKGHESKCHKYNTRDIDNSCYKFGVL